MADLYIGIRGVARRASSAYIGKDNVARSICNGYIGVNNVARKFFPGIVDGEYGSKVISGTKTKGSTVKFDGIEWIVVNISGNKYTLMLKKMTETTQFDTSAYYSASMIASKCTAFQYTMSSNALSVVNSKTVESVTAKVWIATKSMIEGWTDSSNPTSNAWSGIRKWTANDGVYDSVNTRYYWCSNPFNTYLAWCVTYDGYFGYLDSNSPGPGFRPCIEVVQ